MKLTRLFIMDASALLLLSLSACGSQGEAPNTGAVEANGLTAATNAPSDLGANATGAKSVDPITNAAEAPGVVVGARDFGTNAPADAFGATVATKAEPGTSPQALKSYRQALTCLSSTSVLAGMDGKAEDADIVTITNDYEARLMRIGKTIGLNDTQIEADFDAVTSKISKDANAANDKKQTQSFHDNLMQLASQCAEAS